MTDTIEPLGSRPQLRRGVWSRENYEFDLKLYGSWNIGLSVMPAFQRLAKGAK